MKTQKIVIGTLTGMAILYLLFAFVKLDFNAGNWPESTRLGFAVTLIFGGWLGVLLECIK